MNLLVGIGNAKSSGFGQVLACTGRMEGNCIWCRKPPTMEHTQTKRQSLKHERTASLLPEKRFDGIQWIPYSCALTISVHLKKSSRLPPALRDKNYDSRSFSLFLLFSCAFIPEEHRANLFSSEEEVVFLREPFWGRKTYQYATERAVEDWVEVNF